MPFSNSTVDGRVTASITAPASSGDPATIRSLLSARALAAVAGKAIIQIELVADSTAIYIRDSADKAGYPNDYFPLPATISTTNALDTFVISSGSAAVARLLIHTHRDACI